MVHALESLALGRAGLGRRRAEPAARPASVRGSSTRFPGDWGGKVMTDLDAVFNAVSAMPFVDASRAGICRCRATADTRSDCILGHTNRFKAAVTL